MRLTDLLPRWCGLGLVAGSPRFDVGVTFLCPHCRVTRLGVMFANPIDPSGFAQQILIPIFERAWTRDGDTFDTLTLSPSIDTSQHGHWHGFIRNGEIE